MSHPAQIDPASSSNTTNAASPIPKEIGFSPPEVPSWLLKHAGEPAAERRSLRLRLAVVEHDLGQGLDLAGREDFRCLARREIQASDEVVAQAVGLLRDLAPRGLICDEEGDGARLALTIAAAELVERGQVASLLVICPARDCAEWVERLNAGFGLSARQCGEDGIGQLADGSAWVIDHGTAVARAQQIHDRNFGVVLLDEIHELDRNAVRALRNALREDLFLFARTSSPLDDGFPALHRALDLVRGNVAHPLGNWEEFLSIFLGNDARAQLPRKGTEDELRNRLTAWVRRDATSTGGDAGARRVKRSVKEHLVDAQPREKEYLDQAWRAALGFPESARGHYLAAVLGGPWAFAEAVEKAIANNLVQEPALRRVLQDLVVRGRSMRETAKTAQVATIARKIQKDRDARVLICVRSGATANGLAHALAQAGFLDQTDVLKENQEGLNRMAIQRFVLGERKILIVPDGAARGQAVPCVTDVIHFGPALEAAEHVARMERLGNADGAQCVIHRIVLRGTPEESAIHTAQQRLGFHDLEADQVCGWLADLGFPAGDAGWTRLLMERVEAVLSGTSREDELLPLLERRKRVESARQERRRAADRVLGKLQASRAASRIHYSTEAPRFTVAQLVAASLELRQGGWRVTEDKRILLEHEGKHFELRVPERSGRTLPQAPSPEAAVLDCEPGSWAWERLTQQFREGSSFFLADARSYPLDRVRKRLAESLGAHGLVIESLEIVDSIETVSAALTFRATAHSGPERHEALLETRSCPAGHQLDAYLEAPETLPWPDGSRTPLVRAIEGETAAAVEEAFARAGTAMESAVREREELGSFLADAAARPATLHHPAAALGLHAAVEGLVGLLYRTATVEARVRHRDQTASWPIRLQCVPVSGVILGEIPAPSGISADAPLWACAGGHLVAAGSITVCAAEGCTTGLCAVHAGSDSGLHACAECGAAHCAEHSQACAGCGTRLCAAHLTVLDSGSPACSGCTETLEDGRRFLNAEIAWSAV